MVPKLDSQSTPLQRQRLSFHHPTLHRGLYRLSVPIRHNRRRIYESRFFKYNAPHLKTSRNTQPRRYPVDRKRVEMAGIILFCALMATVTVELIIESAHVLGVGPSGGKELKAIRLAFVRVASTLTSLSPTTAG